MSKQNVSAEEKHYIKLNNKLHKEINELKLDKIKLIDSNTLLRVENESLLKTVKQQQEWMLEISKQMDLAPSEFRKYLEDISNKVILEQRTQDQLDFIKRFLGKFI